MRRDPKRSREDYLRTIDEIREEKGYCRSVDVAQALGVTRASVSVAVRHMQEEGELIMDKKAGSHLLLTPKGREAAREVISRNRVLYQFLLGIGLPPESAREQAHALEHDISDETCRALLRQVGERMPGTELPGRESGQAVG